MKWKGMPARQGLSNVSSARWPEVRRKFQICPRRISRQIHNGGDSVGHVEVIIGQAGMGIRVRAPGTAHALILKKGGKLCVGKRYELYIYIYIYIHDRKRTRAQVCFPHATAQVCPPNCYWLVGRKCLSVLVPFSFELTLPSVFLAARCGLHRLGKKHLCKSFLQGTDVTAPLLPIYIEKPFPCLMRTG